MSNDGIDWVEDGAGGWIKGGVRIVKEPGDGGDCPEYTVHFPGGGATRGFKSVDDSMMFVGANYHPQALTSKATLKKFQVDVHDERIRRYIVDAVDEDDAREKVEESDDTDEDFGGKTLDSNWYVALVMEVE